jgi:hypothetical protein
MGCNVNNLICSFIKFGHPAKRQHNYNNKVVSPRIYEEKWLLEVLQDRKRQKLSNILVLESIEEPNIPPRIVGEVTQIFIQGEWAFADILFTDKTAYALVLTDKRFVRPMMIGEFDEPGNIMGIRELRYLYLTHPDDCSWPNEVMKYETKTKKGNKDKDSSVNEVSQR